ncbi:BglG family transcription antiterminator [Clostridium sediminicola]|uniref:BglG family transcription antiterminator n=1 Tax=Clostridium sediminicola TaxID=3114879 RepID=UPI0031F22CBE
MELNKRCIELIQCLIDENDYVKINKLSQKFNVSDRTIRYDVEKIEKFLLSNGFGYIQRQHLKGVRIEKNDILKTYLEKFINSKTPYSYNFSKEERKKYILIKLLEECEPVKIEHFMKTLYISKNTVIKEMEYIGLWLKTRKLKLIKKPRIGVLVEGDEFCKRMAISEITEEYVSSGEILNYVNTKVVKSKSNNLQFNLLFSKIDLDFLDSLVRIAEMKLFKEFNDMAYGNLITHLALMIKRLQLNKKIFLPMLEMSEIENSFEYDVAKELIDKINKKFNIVVPNEEINYIALHLLGAKVIKSEINNRKIEYDNDGLYSITEKMLNEIGKIYKVDFGEYKQLIIENLVLHLRPTIYRIKFNLKLNNPLYEEIKSKYYELFLNTKHVTRYLENYIDSSIDEQEISYITLHFGVALEKIKENASKISRVILVCGTGIGTANMLAMQLSKKFQIKIIDIVSIRTVKRIDKSEYDFIISTVDLENFDNKDYIKISPLLLRADYEKIKKYLNIKFEDNKKYEDLNMVNRLIDVVEKYCHINDIHQLQNEFMYELKRKNNFNLLVQNEEKNLKDMLSREFIFLNAHCLNWRQAIREGTKLLQNKGFVEYDFEINILKKFKEIGPYMVVAPGIVLSHARPDEGVKKLGMSLVTLRRPITFGSELNDPVRIVFTLAAVDNEKHLRALSQLMELFLNNKDIKEITNASKKEEVLKIISKYSMIDY